MLLLPEEMQLLTVYFALLIKTGKHFGLYLKTGGGICINYTYLDLSQPTLLPRNDPFEPLSVCDTVGGVALHPLDVLTALCCLVNLVNVCSLLSVSQARVINYFVWIVSAAGGSDRLHRV